MLWAYTPFGGTAERSDADPRTGTWHARLVSGGFGFASVAQALADLSPGAPAPALRAELWVRQAVPGAPLFIGLTDYYGSIVPRWLIVSDTAVEEWNGDLSVRLSTRPAAPQEWLLVQLYLEPVVAAELAGETITLLIMVNDDVPAGHSYAAGAVWHVDDVGVTDMALTQLLEADLLADLANISVANGFDTDVAEVSADPLDAQHATMPSVELNPDEGGDAEVSELGDRAAAAEQQWTLRLLVAGATHRADIQNLLDDVRNTVATGTLSQRSGVESAKVATWDAPLLEESIGEQRASMRAVVRARYNYLRGAL